MRARQIPHLDQSLKPTIPFQNLTLTVSGQLFLNLVITTDSSCLQLGTRPCIVIIHSRALNIFPLPHTSKSCKRYLTFAQEMSTIFSMSENALGYFCVLSQFLKFEAYVVLSLALTQEVCYSKYLSRDELQKMFQLQKHVVVGFTINQELNR